MGKDNSFSENETATLLPKDVPATHDTKQTQFSSTQQNLMLLVILSLKCVSMMADTLIAPFFPDVADRKGLSYVHTGVVFSSFEIARFITSPIAGSFLERCPPKIMCLVGNIVAAVACISFGTIIQINHKYAFFTLCVVTRLLAGIGSAMLMVASTSVLLKATSRKSGTIVGLLEIMNGAGYILGPVFGAAIYSVAGYAPMFWFTGGMMLLYLPIFVAVIPKIDESQKRYKHFLGLATIPGCTLMFLNCLAIRIGGSTRLTGISNWITSQYDKPTSFVGLLFGIWSIIYIITCSVISWLINKGYAYHLLISGFCISLFPNLLMGPSHLLDFIFHGQKYLWQPVVGMALINVFSAFIFVPPLQVTLELAYVNGYSKDSVQTYGMVTGFINSGLSLGAAVGPTMSGAISDAFDYSWSLTVIGFLSLSMGLATLAYWTYMRLTNQPLCFEQMDKQLNQVIEDITVDSTHANKHSGGCIENGGISS